MENEITPPNPDHYAIVIGINTYSQLRPLNAAVDDAVRFAEWLKKPNGGGLPGKNVKLIVSPVKEIPPEPFPVADHIDRALIEMGIKVRERVGKRLYFYFAGHGIGPTFDDVGMLMASAAMDQLNFNLGLGPYRTFLRKRKPFVEVIYILDCCRDETKNARLGEPSFTLPDAEGGDNVRDLSIMAAKFGEKAFEPKDKTLGERRSILTKVLLNGLEKHEAADPLGRITNNTLVDYIVREVPRSAEESKLKQSPVIEKWNLEQELVLCTVPASGKYKRVHIIANVREADGELILLDHSNREMISKPAIECTAAAPWEVPILGNWFGIRYSKTPDAPPKLVDLRNVSEDPYVVEFVE